MGFHVGQHKHRIDCRVGQEFFDRRKELATELLGFGDSFFSRTIPKADQFRVAEFVDRFGVQVRDVAGSNECYSNFLHDDGVNVNQVSERSALCRCLEFVIPSFFMTLVLSK